MRIAQGATGVARSARESFSNAQLAALSLASKFNKEPLQMLEAEINREVQ